MNEPDIIPQLKHCQAEIDEASKNMDVVRLKAIFKREGFPWYVRDESGNYIPDISDDTSSQESFG